MPPGVNHAAFASAGAIAVSVAVAAAIAIYESPELRRYTDDVRRRIAMTLQNLGEGIQPPDRPPMFNRPEDAQGFFESRRGEGAQPGVDADEESRKRQREELMYWNAKRMEKQNKEEKKDTAAKDGPSFDDFLHSEGQGEKESLVFNSGAETREGDATVRRRNDGARNIGAAGAGAGAAAGVTAATTAAVYSNPFADEHNISMDELASSQEQLVPAPPAKDEVMSDIYSSTTRDAEEDKNAAAAGQSLSATLASAAETPPLVDVSTTETATERSATLDRELDDDEYMTAGQDERAQDEAFASIQAWAQGSTRSADDFYSPLPMSPEAPVSEPELVSDGMLTPTDSVSVIDSNEVSGNNDAASSPREGGGNGRLDDVISESDGMLTPSSWSEVGSVVSENDGPVPALA